VVDVKTEEKRWIVPFGQPIEQGPRGIFKQVPSGHISNTGFQFKVELVQQVATEIHVVGDILLCGMLDVSFGCITVIAVDLPSGQVVWELEQQVAYPTEWPNARVVPSNQAVLSFGHWHEG